MSPTQPKFERETLPHAVSHLLGECRMVLPGIQALFGFQLIAVFSQPFWERLEWPDQVFHLTAIGLVTISIALVMTPVAYHRQVEPEIISEHFIVLSTRLLTLSMFPLMLGISLDVYIIGKIILQSWIGGVMIASILLTIFLVFWFVLPRLPALQKIFCGPR